MPALINTSANFFLGAWVAMGARKSESFRQHFVSWPLLTLFAFEVAVLPPFTTYLFRFYPQWSMLYWFDPQIYPNMDAWVGWMSGGVVLLNLIAALAGFVIARAGVHFQQGWLSGLPLVLGVAGVGFILVAFGDRVLYVGSYDQFWQGDRTELWLCPPGWVGSVMYLTVGAFAWWTRRTFRAKSHAAT